MLFNPTSYTTTITTAATSTILNSRDRLDDEHWIPILQHQCDFNSDVFESVTINLIRNPNINSSHLFRADILYDSLNNQYTNVQWPAADLQRLRRESAISVGNIPGFRLKRSFIRQMIPRNPQLDKPVAQTCHILTSIDLSGTEQNLVIYIPHVTDLEGLPWYHPAVQSLAYLHTWRRRPATPDSNLNSEVPPGVISIHYRLFPSQILPLPQRVLRTAHHLLATLYKHGQGSIAGYTKRVHHDRLVSQQRVQNTYAELKRKHAKRLCDRWVEQTEPSKHVFEDLGIAAFLIELWKDMYQLPTAAASFEKTHPTKDLPPFPGFVDIGCGNGVLVEILLLSGFRGWGFDARRRKTWSILSPITQENLHELVLIPQPLCDIYSKPLLPSASLLSRLISTISPPKELSDHPHFPVEAWHNGIFPQSTFIISNHADELTPWTPLLASLSHSPFLAIPCCSHNLSGVRFRAPSVFNSLSADRLAPTYFAKEIKTSKSVAISVTTSPEEELDEGFGENALSSPKASHNTKDCHGTSLSHPESGDLNALSPSSRAKQPSAYSSLCDWVSHLASSVDYVVEHEILRIPSTRNVGIVGRAWARDGGIERHDGTKKIATKTSVCSIKDKAQEIILETVTETASDDDKTAANMSSWDDDYAKRLVMELVRREGADGAAWVERCRNLAKVKSKVCGHG